MYVFVHKTLKRSNPGHRSEFFPFLFAGGETISREDIMEAIERSKFGINNKQLRSNTISNELERLFPWMTSLMGRNDKKLDRSQGPLGYQTLS